MALINRKPPLPDDLHDAWWSFLDCAAVIEGGVRQLLACLPVGRVEPAPIGIGVDALKGAIDDCRGWMPGWKLDELDEAWDEAERALAASESHLVNIREVAATTSELEELQDAIQSALAPLDRFADAEKAWRRRWRVPRDSARQL